jgi:hypothetical protein
MGKQHPMDRLQAQPLSAEMRARLGRMLDMVIQSDPDLWEEDARPMIREARAAYRRGGRRAARAVIDLHRRRGLHGPLTAARAPRAAGTRRHGSRRSSSTRGSPDDDDGGGDPDPPHVGRSCSTCGGSCRPIERTCARCRQRRSRARRRAERPSSVWPEALIVAAAVSIEPTATIAALMADPPHGVLTEAVVA